MYYRFNRRNRGRAGQLPMSNKTTIEINYAPTFSVRYGHGKPPAYFIKKLFDFNRKKQLSFIDRMTDLQTYYERIPIQADENDLSPRWANNWIPPCDGMTIYANVVFNNPEKIVEIGSGNSTKFFRRAIDDHRLGSKLISIDPQPRATIDAIADEVYRRPIEAMDLSVFETLEKGDIVFFDGSHRCFQNSDVTVFFVDILPMLSEGVVVGVHDISWPQDYPPHWKERYYNEQYLLAAHILALGNRFPLVFSCAYCGPEFQKELMQCIGPQISAGLKSMDRNVSGGALWFTKHHCSYG